MYAGLFCYTLRIMSNPERVTYFAATDSRGKRVPFGIKSKDRDRHMYVIGKTGMGKSTLLENMAIQDLRNGEGLAFIDPHGGTVDHLLDFIPEERLKDVVYFAPFDMDNPIAFNVMEDVGYDKRHLVVSGLMATFKKIWEDAWSARMEYILTNTLLALLEYPDATLLGVNRMYTDKTYRTRVIDNVKDPVVKDFWVKEFANYGDRYTQEATPAIQNKIGQFTGNPLIRNIIGQPKSSFDIRTMMDERKILIINLSKGLVGETNMRLLGSMITTRIFLSAMSRADLSAADMTKMAPFYFYVDEFQNFANETFADILSEARKYKLNLIIAHQYIEQMEEEVRDAVFGNVGTTVAFRVGPFDAETLETIFMPRFLKEDIVSLDKRQIYLSLMIDGVGSAPFSAVTIPPIEPPPVSYRSEVVALSRKQFAVPRAGVEQAIMEELQDSLASDAPADARMRKPFKKPAGTTYSPSSSQIRPPATHVNPTQPSPAAPATVSRPAETLQRPSSRVPEPLRPSEDATVRPAASDRTEQKASPRSFDRARPPQHVPRQERLAPPPAQKSASELKDILRTLTQKAATERDALQRKRQDSLKGTLSVVLPNNAPTPHSQDQKRETELPTPQARPKTVPQALGSNVPNENGAPAAPLQVRPTEQLPMGPAAVSAAVPTPEEKREEQKTPFEIPEAQLRKVLREDT